MKKYLLLAFALIGVLTIASCSDSEDPIVTPPPSKNVEVQDFIWKGLNTWYLWKPNVNDLSDSRFSNHTEYVEYLNQAPGPEDFFESLIYNRTSVDKWSWIVDDYVALEKSFEGITTNNGTDFKLTRISEGSDDLVGYVRYVMPQSPAEDTEIKRGDLFTHVNGTQITVQNYSDLLFGTSSTYTLSLAKIENGEIVSTGVEVSLTNEENTDYAVHTTKVIEEAGRKIGYLLYNNFFGEEDVLNNAFLEFKNQGVTDLIVDLRYNRGGYGHLAKSMASMITGQFKGELWYKDQFNPQIQAELEASNPDWIYDYFSDKMQNGNSINSLELSKVHFIITNESASASEVIINGLKPYIDVRLVGETTSGKYTGSFTLYDSENFTKSGVNPNHKYAMQPIVMEGVNKLGEKSVEGYQPHIEISERVSTYGVIGDPNEPLLRRTINDIIGIAPKIEPGKFDLLFPWDDYASSQSKKLEGILLIDANEDMRKAISKKIFNN